MLHAGGVLQCRMSKQSPSQPEPFWPEVNFSEDGSCRYLHLGTEWVQGAMRLKDPLKLELEYIQRMMAWLLFVEPDSVPERHAMQLGLGAGSLTRFTYGKLGMLTSCIEFNPQVYMACRQWFRLPDNNEKLNVMLGDAGEEIRQPEWQGAIDALQVDLYDEEAAAPVLDDPDFYGDCRALLTPEGCMTVNLFGRDSSYEDSLTRIAEAFGPAAVWAFKPTREGNTVVLAQRTPLRFERALLDARALDIQNRWGLPAGRWVKVLRPLAEQP